MGLFLKQLRSPTYRQKNASTFLLVAILLTWSTLGGTQKIKVILVSKTTCDRYSLDALYHENYSPSTRKALDESASFFGKILDNFLEDLQGVMSNLPGRDSSDNEDRNLYLAFTSRKKHFNKKIAKFKKNITESWEGLLTANHRFLANNGSANEDDVSSWVVRVYDAYAKAKEMLDGEVKTVVEPLKGIIMNGLQGIEKIVDMDEEKEKRLAEMSPGNVTAKQVPRKERRKKIISIVVPNFLQKVTLASLNRKIDPEKKWTAADRDSILDDMYFIVTMIKGRALSILRSEFPMNEERQDAARQAIYTYWATLDKAMYENRLMETKEGGPSNDGEDDSTEIADKLAALFEEYT